MRSIEDLRFRLTLGGLVAVWFGIFYAGADWLMAGERDLPSVALPLDELIPFWPWFAVAYLCVTPFLWLPLLVIRERADLTLLALVLMSEIVIAAVFYVVFPVADPPVPPSPYPFVFTLADTINLTRNNLPSLHVALTLTTLLAIWSYLRRFATVALVVAGLICVSTLFTRQHDVASVLGGVGLALVGHLLLRPVFRRWSALG